MASNGRRATAHRRHRLLVSKCCSALCFAELPPRPLLVVSCWARQMLGAADWNRRREPRATDHHPFIPRLDSSSYCPVLSFPFSLHLHIHLILFPLLRFHPLSLRLVLSSFCHTLRRAPFSTATTYQPAAAIILDAAGRAQTKRSTEKPLHPIHHHPTAGSRLFSGVGTRGKICASAAYLIIDTIH